MIQRTICLIFLSLNAVCGSFRTLLPATNNTMKDLPIILKALMNQIPFGFAHFNDGEMQALDCIAGKKAVFTWEQACSANLGRAIHNALTHTAPNFYLGLPCNCEFRGRYFLKALHVLNITHNLPYTLEDTMLSRGVYNDDTACPVVPARLTFPTPHLRGRITVAPLFINGNYNHAKKELIRLLIYARNVQQRAIHIVTAHGRHVERLPIPISSTQWIAQKDAFEHNYETFRTSTFLNNVAKYKDGDIVMIMGGPFGRILASEWTWLRPNVTFLELGSFWDTELWNRPKHHLGSIRRCSSNTDTIGVSSCSFGTNPILSTFFC